WFDTAKRIDVYVRDVVTGVTTLVNRADGARGAKGNSESPFGGSLSANGRYVAFTSFAWNLDPVDALSDNTEDAFGRDLHTHQTTLASRSPSGARGKGRSELPALSGDGRYMVFTSAANNFGPPHTDSRPDVYVRDLRAPLPSPGRPPRSSIRSVRQTGAFGQGGFSVTGRAGDDGELQLVEGSRTRGLRARGRGRGAAIPRGVPPPGPPGGPLRAWDPHMGPAAKPQRPLQAALRFRR